MVEEKPEFNWRAPPDWVWRPLVFLVALAGLVLITTRWSRWESNAQDFQRVRSEEVLAQLVDDDYRATVDQLTARVAAAAAQIEALKAQRSLQSANVQDQILSFKALGGGWRSTRTAAQR